MPGFYNVMTDTTEEEAVEENRHGLWQIKLGFPGFNSRMNNYGGYLTKEKAEEAIRRHIPKP